MKKNNKEEPRHPIGKTLVIPEDIASGSFYDTLRKKLKDSEDGEDEEPQPKNKKGQRKKPKTEQ